MYNAVMLYYFCKTSAAMPSVIAVVLRMASWPQASHRQEGVNFLKTLAVPRLRASLFFSIFSG